MGQCALTMDDDPPGEFSDHGWPRDRVHVISLSQRVTYEARRAPACDGRSLVGERARRDAIGYRGHKPIVAAGTQRIFVLARTAVVAVRGAAGARGTHHQRPVDSGVEDGVGRVTRVVRKARGDL